MGVKWYRLCIVQGQEHLFDLKDICSDLEEEQFNRQTGREMWADWVGRGQLCVCREIHMLFDLKEWFIGILAHPGCVIHNLFFLFSMKSTCCQDKLLKALGSCSKTWVHIFLKPPWFALTDALTWMVLILPFLVNYLLLITRNFSKPGKIFTSSEIPSSSRVSPSFAVLPWHNAHFKERRAALSVPSVYHVYLCFSGFLQNPGMEEYSACWGRPSAAPTFLRWTSLS